MLTTWHEALASLHYLVFKGWSETAALCHFRSVDASKEESDHWESVSVAMFQWWYRTLHWHVQSHWDSHHSALHANSCSLQLKISWHNEWMPVLESFRLPLCLLASNRAHLYSRCLSHPACSSYSEAIIFWILYTRALSRKARYTFGDKHLYWLVFNTDAIWTIVYWVLKRRMALCPR